MYPEEIITPMREELTSLGVKELRTAEEVDQVFKDKEGTTLLVINSICGCAAGNARPGIKLALENDLLPDKLTTVFAGQDREATEQARAYLSDYPPSSPSIALLKEGQLVEMIQRHQIEGRQPDQIAGALKEAFDKYCK